MKKSIISLLILALGLLAVAIVFLTVALASQDASDPVISKEYSYTKAICSEGNFCQDYIIICDGPNMLSKAPIDGATAQYSLDWQDPRSYEAINGFCLLSSKAG